MLNTDELNVFDLLSSRISSVASRDGLLDSYYNGRQKLQSLGIATPPELSVLETVVNWPRLVVDTLGVRMKVKSFMVPGSEIPAADLMDGWQANNLDTEQSSLFADKHIFGRAFMTVGTNDEDSDFPLICVESPREMSVLVDPRTRKTIAALKLYSSEGAPTYDSASGVWVPMPVNENLATLYLPDVTIWLEKNSGKWYEVNRDDHRLGRVPVVPIFNNKRSGHWNGVSEMADAIPLTDAACRALTNLQLAQETHAAPQKVIMGVGTEDFTDQDGNLLPKWNTYLSSLLVIESSDAKIGTFGASDLKNFTETVDHYGRLVAGQYGLPIRYLGQGAANPPSADAIRAEESGLILRAEKSISQASDALGRVMAIWNRFRTGEWINGSLIKAEFFDPATPSKQALTDSVQKLFHEKLISREGSWDRLGFSESEKEREREYFAAEANDPLMAEALSAMINQPSAPQAS